MALTIIPSTVAPGGRLEYDAPPDAQLVVGYKYRVYIDTLSNGATSNGGRIRGDGIRNSIAAPTGVGNHLLVIQVQPKANATWLTAVSKLFTVAVLVPVPPDPALAIGNVVVTPGQTSARVTWTSSALSTGRVLWRVKGTVVWNTRLPMQTTPSYTNHEQSIDGLTGGTAYEFSIGVGLAADDYDDAVYAGSFTTTGTNVPPPVDPTRVVIPDSATSAAHIRDFLGSHLGTPTALRTKQYSMGGTLDLAGFDGVDCDPVGCQMVFPIGVEIQLRNAKNIRFVSPATRWKIAGATAAGFLPGHYYQRADGTTYGNEHMHAFAMEGAQHVELAGFDIDVVSGDGFYGGSYGTAMATDVHLHDFSVKQCGRMVFGLVAAKGWRVDDYVTRDVAYTIVDCEPEFYNAGAIQGVIDCIFRRGKAYGTVGAIHQGANFYDYATAIQMGTPSVAGSIAPVISGVTVDDLEVFDAPKGIFTRVGQGSYRIQDVTLNKCVGHAFPWPDPVILIEGVDGGSISNCRSPKPAGGQLWAQNDCKNFADGGGNVVA